MAKQRTIYTTEGRTDYLSRVERGQYRYETDEERLLEIKRYVDNSLHIRSIKKFLDAAVDEKLERDKL